MTWALVRKDLRLFRVPVVAGLVVLAGVYAVGARDTWRLHATFLKTSGHAYVINGVVNPEAEAQVRESAFGWALAYELMPAARVGLILSVLFAAAYGGLAFAAERRDRSAEFLGMLPVPRRRIVASKLLVALTSLLLPCVVHVSVLLAVPHWAGLNRDAIVLEQANLLRGADECVTFTLMLFGVAWLCSSFGRSPATAAVVAVGACVVVVYAVGAYGWARDPHLWQSPDLIWHLVARYETNVPAGVLAAARSAMVAGGLLALVAGSAIYVRRVEP